MGTTPKKSWKIDGCKGSFFCRGKKNIIWYRRGRNDVFSTKLSYTPKNRILAGQTILEEENRGIRNNKIRTIGQALEYFEKSTMLKKGDSTRSVLNYNYNVIFPDRDKLITDFKYIQSRIEFIKNGNYVRSTVYGYLSSVSSLFNFLIKKNILINSPISRDDYPKVQSKVIDIYSDDELNKLFNYFKSQDYEYYLFLSFLYKTAFRFKETLSLKKNQVWFSGNYRPQIIIPKSKFGTKPDYFPISPSIQELIEQIPNFNNLDNDDVIWSFANRTRSYLRHKLINAMAELGIPRKSSDYPGTGRTYHTFRKTRITHWIQQGISVHGLEKLSRDNYQTVRKYYDAVNTDDYSDFVD